MSDDVLNGEIESPDDPATVTLSKPLKVIGKMVTTLTFRPPTGLDLMQAGAVMRFITNDTKETAVEIIPSGMGKMIARLANIPMRSVEWLPATDFQQCSNAVLGFLGDGASQTPSTDTSNAPISGAGTSLTSSG